MRCWLVRVNAVSLSVSRLCILIWHEGAQYDAGRGAAVGCRRRGRGGHDVSRLRTEMSSSTSSQWMPTPPPIRRQFRSCFGDARSRRGNHSSGADTVRPSFSATTSESAVKETSTASAAVLLMMVVVPSVDKLITILLNHTAERRKLVAAKSPRLRQFNRLQPEFRILLRPLNMNVSRFMSFTTEKEEPESPRAQYFWHGARLAPRVGGVKRLPAGRRRAGHLAPALRRWPAAPILGSHPF